MRKTTITMEDGSPWDGRCLAMVLDKDTKSARRCRARGATRGHHVGLCRVHGARRHSRSFPHTMKDSQ